MKNKITSKTIVQIVIIILSALFIIIGYNICKYEAEELEYESFYTAKVLSVHEPTISEFSLDEGVTMLQNKTIPFMAKITTGENKGEIINATQAIDPLYHTDIAEVAVNDNVIIIENGGLEEGKISWQFVEFNRSDNLIILCVLFLLAIVLLARVKGVSTIISLIFTAAAIFVVYVPAILSGFNVYLITAIIGIFIILMSLTVINGVNIKTLSAIVGNIGGVAITALLAYGYNSILNITGVIEEQYLYLTFLETEVPIDLKAIVWGGIVIGSLGAIMDVSMSIASAMNELAETMEDKSFVRMLKSGFNIGKDAIGTMTNTLILAYIGSSLATVLLIVANNRDLLFIFNMEMIVVEVLQAIVGSIGILFAVPATALFCAWIFNKDSMSKGPKKSKTSMKKLDEVMKVLEDKQ